MRDLTRRQFVYAASVLAGFTASLLLPGGRTLSAGKAQAAGVDFLESSCNSGDRAGKKILVAYASRCGTTGGVAEAMGRTLCGSGFDVDICLAKHAGDVSPYCAVVLGSAIHRASWLPEAIEFARKNREPLSRVPVAYFLTCLALHEETEESRKLAKSYMEPVLKAVPEVRPVDSGLFAGVLDYSNMDALSRMAMKVMGKGVPEGDFRNWRGIASWAKGLAGTLRS